MTNNVSVIIPTFNRASYLLLTLTSFVKQTYQDFELIIVDDGSTDNTSEVVASFFSDIANLKYVKQENLGRSKARNRGIHLASGEIFIFSEDDYIVKPDFVSQHLSSHKGRPDIAVVGGIGYRIITHLLPQKEIKRYTHYQKLKNDLEFGNRIRNINEPWTPIVTPEDMINDFDWVKSLSFPDEVIANRINYVENRFGRDFEGFLLPWLFFGGGNISVSKNLINKFGTFNEIFEGWGAEDLELGYRLYRNGASFVLNQKTRSFHQVHFRDRLSIKKEAGINNDLFCKIHPFYEVLLFKRHMNPKYSNLSAKPITIEDYNERVLKYYHSDEKTKELMFKSLVKEIEYLSI